jgi:hypothetical protein
MKHKTSVTRRSAAVSTILALAAGTTDVRADCAAEVRTALERMRDASPSRMDMTAKTGPTTVRTIYDNNLPRALRVRMEFSADDSVIETVIIGERVWRGDGKTFLEADAATARTIAETARAQVKRATPAVETAQCAGRETLEGRSYDVFVYERTFPVMSATGTATSRLFIDPVTRMPARQIVTTRAAGTETIAETRITYDATITIEPPPTKP